MMLSQVLESRYLINYRKAAKRVYGLIKALSDPGEMIASYRNCVVENIKGFAFSNRFN